MQKGTAFVTTVVVTLSLAVIIIQRSSCRRENDDDDTSSSSSKHDEHHQSTTALPSHIQRELYKEQRRKANIRYLAMKKPIYDNIGMYDPDDILLCTIGKKKANWYVQKKKLAVWKVPSKSIRLLFTPKSNARSNKKSTVPKEEENDEDGCSSEQQQQPQYVLQSKSDKRSISLYNTSHKKNICVACGVSDGLMRHYVVPYSYRKLLPTKFKSHLSHDIVLLCLDCHIVATQNGIQQRELVFEKLYRTDPETCRLVIPNPRLRHVKSCAQALCTHRMNLPPDRIIQYEQVITDYLSSASSLSFEGDATSSSSQQQYPSTISISILQQLAQTLETDIPNPKYIPISVLVTNTLCKTDEDVTQFIISWRQLFVDTLQPRYLPIGWSVDSPVENDG